MQIMLVVKGDECVKLRDKVWEIEVYCKFKHAVNQSVDWQQARYMEFEQMYSSGKHNHRQAMVLVAVINLRHPVVC